MVNESGYVERFAWFAVPVWSRVEPASNMVDEIEYLIPTGTIYAALWLDRMVSLSGDALLHAR